jgi:hypothetical protein
MDFREVVSSMEWQKMYKALLSKWKYEFRSAAQAIEREKHLKHQAKYEMIEEIMAIPLSGLKGEDADLYIGKMRRDKDKLMEEQFKDGNHGR